MRTRRTKIVAGVVVLAALVGGGAAWATAGGDDDKPLTDSNRAKAVAAALAHTGGGTVTETEVGDDGAAYGVEVRLGNDKQVEVELDANFEVIRGAADDDGRGEEDGSADD
jgi:peptidase YpeB-like protein